MANRRSVLYLILGAVLAGAGIVMMFCSRLGGGSVTMLGGLILYLASIPLLFQAKLTAIAGRLALLERRAGRRCVAATTSARYQGEEGD
jgi:hypothetical protein